MDVSPRFTRTKLLLGDEAFARLTAGHVAVIGLGAVGGYAVEGLARAGVGRLTVVDFDTIQPSNINRQILALESTIGETKAGAARHRILEINPACQVQALHCFADSTTIQEILALLPDVVIDAIDSLNPKMQILSACHQRQVKVFSSMGAALRSDPLRIRIGDIAETNACPLARRLRKRLRSAGIASGITCVYSTEQVEFDYQPPDNADRLATDPQRGRTRRTLGSLPTLTAMFGLILANEVIKWLAGDPP
ncbi:MAG: tRNA threonylcarbamoyladenosine dehydratase [Desulfofustis sp.]|nr:tRNA threonylcarbamoyladenosine dehydratase [Desulfofustis sp.]